MTNENYYKSPGSDLGVRKEKRYTWKNHAYAILFSTIVFMVANEIVVRIWGYFVYDVSIFYEIFHEYRLWMMSQSIISTLVIAVLFVSLPILVISQYRKLSKLIILLLALAPSALLLTFVYKTSTLTLMENATRTIVIGIVYGFFFKRKIA